MKRAVTVSLGLSFACSLTCGALAQVDVAHRVEVTADGAHDVIEYRNSSGGTYEHVPSGGMIDGDTVPRWIEADGGLGWICESIDVGDNGAIVMAGKSLNNESVTLYTSNSPQPIFDFSTLGSELEEVVVADRADGSAAFVVVDMDPGPGFDFEGTLYAFSNTGTGIPEWDYTFPRTLNYFGGGAALSDDGQVVLTWKADPISEKLLIEAFREDGTPISSGRLSSVSGPNTFFNSRQTRLSDDGSRAYFFVGVDAIIYDVATGTEEFRHTIGASFDSHSLSGDGKRFAFGNFGFFEVYEETGPGAWSRIARESFAGGTYVARVDLNTDGSRMGFQVQRYSPATDYFEIGMYDVDGSSFLFNESHEALGTSHQLAARGVEVDDRGDYVAGINWGDSFNLVPEGMVYDAAGNLTCSIDSRGSAFSIGFDADGDVFAMGTKAIHANTSGRGGDVIVADAYEQALHVVGFPQRGEVINIEVPDVGTQVRITVCDELGTTNTPFGPAEVKLSTELTRLGPISIPGGGLVYPVRLPNIAALAGRDIHLQALITRGGTGRLTNKVSLRVQP